jgi:chromosome segregation ATPase
MSIEQLLETYVTLDSAREEIRAAVNDLECRASKYEREVQRLNARDLEKSQALHNKIEEVDRLTRENKRLSALVGSLGALCDELLVDREELREKLATEEVLFNAARLNFYGMKEERDEAVRRRDLAEERADTWKRYAKRVRWQRDDLICEAKES